MSAHVGSRLIFFLSVVGNFLLVLSVVGNIFSPLSLVGYPHSHPRKSAQSHNARQKQLLTGYLRTVVIYAFSEHKTKLYATCILCMYLLIQFWLLSRFWQERDCNAVPFERWFMSQSVCKCDCSLSQGSITKARYFECLVFLLQPITGISFRSSQSRGIREKSRKEICIAWSKLVF